MATREFKITELKRAGEGGYVDTPVSFTWDVDHMSSPRGTWKFGVEMRTVREDYPGADEPVEQVLGSNYKEFSLQGVWDDRYNYPGFALLTQKQFEALTKRGSVCRFEFESLSFNGIIKSAEFDYKRASLIAYTFMVSPHKRTAGNFTIGTVDRKKAAEAFTPVGEYRNQAVVGADFLASLVSPAPSMRGTTDDETKGLIRRIREGVASLVSAVEQRFDKSQDRYVDVKRTAAALNVVKGTAAEMLFLASSYKSSTALAYEDAKAILDFDCWRTDLTRTARTLGLLGASGSAELARRVDPKTVALYRPRKDESLYAISQRFYGTPTAWRTIASANGLTTITLQGTELLVIPERRT